MVEWIAGLLVLAILVAGLLVALDLADGFDLLLGALKTTAGLLFAVGAFFVYLTRRTQQKRQ